MKWERAAVSIEALVCTGCSAAVPSSGAAEVRAAAPSFSGLPSSFFGSSAVPAISSSSLVSSSSSCGRGASGASRGLSDGTGASRGLSDGTARVDVAGSWAGAVRAVESAASASSFMDTSGPSSVTRSSANVRLTVFWLLTCGSFDIGLCGLGGRIGSLNRHDIVSGQIRRLGQRGIGFGGRRRICVKIP